MKTFVLVLMIIGAIEIWTIVFILLMSLLGVS